MVLVFANCEAPPPSSGPDISGLVAELTFDGTANDTSGDRNHGTVYGATLTTDRFGSVDTAYSFGGDDRIVGSNRTLPLGNASRTIVAWTKASNEAGTDRFVLHYGDNADGGPGNFHLVLDEGTVPWFGNGYGYGGVRGTSAVNDDQWHFLAGTYESGTNTATIYVDGVQEAAGLITTAPDTLLGNSDYRIGCSLDERTSTFFIGSIDDIRVYDRALSEAEILTLYTDQGWQ